MKKEYKPKSGVNSTSFSLSKGTGKSGGDTDSSFSLSKTMVPKKSSVVNRPKGFEF